MATFAHCWVIGILFPWPYLFLSGHFVPRPQYTHTAGIFILKQVWNVNIKCARAGLLRQHAVQYHQVVPGL